MRYDKIMRYFPSLLAFLFLSGLLSASPSSGDETHGIAGIGIVAASDAHGSKNLRDHLVVRQVLDRSPAKKKGLQAGDEIVEIDGARLAGMNFKEAVENHLRGPLGAPVQLIVRRGSQKITFDIVRDIVPANTK